MACARSLAKVLQSLEKSLNNFPPRAPPPIWVGVYRMHILQLIIGGYDPKLVHAIYDGKTKLINRIAIFEFDQNKENATEINYDMYETLVRQTTRIAQLYLYKLLDKEELDGDIESQD